MALQPTAQAEPTDQPTSAPSSGSLPGTKQDAEGKLFSFQVVPADTQVSYTVDEVLFGQARKTTGVTNKVEGDFRLGLKEGMPYFDLSKLRVDLRTLKSDNGMRDAAIRARWLESDRYPYADFVAKEIKQFPGDADQGKEVKFQVSGDMTIREITNPVTFDVTVTYENGILTGEGTTTLLMKDYGFDPPEILGRFTVSDGVVITVKGSAKLVEATSSQLRLALLY